MARRNKGDATPDAFQTEGQSWIKWLEANLKLVLAGLAVVLAAVIGLEFVESSSKRGAAVMTSELTEAVDAYQDATDLRKVLTSTSATELKANYQKALDKLKSFSSSHPDNDATRIAKLYEGDLLARLDQHAEAEQHFQAYVSGAQPDDDLLFFALEGLGYAQEAQKKLDEAAKTFDTLANTQVFYKDYGLKHKGRVLEEKGDKDGAIAAYQAIVEMDPASPLKPYAESRLKALE